MTVPYAVKSSRTASQMVWALADFLSAYLALLSSVNGMVRPCSCPTGE